MPQPETHCRLSPSASSRWIACPYSLRAPSLPAGEAAEEGTDAHAWAADVLLGRCSLPNVPDRFREGITMYADHVQANDVTPIVERKWDSLEIDGFGGTVDCLLVRGESVAVYDFKYGRWPVAAEGNTQLLCYASLAAEHFDVSEFHGVIVQPRAFKGAKIKTAQFSLAQVEEHRERVKWAADSEQKAVGDHCRFCSLRKLGECQDGVTYGITKGWKS